eukprot:GHVU01041505.1.p2 GENE.GHVU01041505.1~~GHVU01041505.1.p2  ORF type:complete len:126 (-),score=13.78 GHVU01041505.1:170-547(-)
MTRSSSRLRVSFRGCGRRRSRMTTRIVNAFVRLSCSSSSSVTTTIACSTPAGAAATSSNSTTCRGHNAMTATAVAVAVPSGSSDGRDGGWIEAVHHRRTWPEGSDARLYRGDSVLKRGIIECGAP